ncbi:MAG: citrulline utilization hydrolase CtlX [Woeseia sp.]
MTSSKESQLASAVLMIRPASFESNPETAESNRFQGRTNASPAEQHAAALEQFESLAIALEDHGVGVLRFDDKPEPHTPDAIFPNNWVSFHADGSIVLYPMEAPNRRLERRPDIIDSLVTDYGYLVRQVVDLSHHEGNGHYLEGTGSLVLDRVNHIAYAGLSTRTHLDPLGEFAQRMDYDIVAFDATDTSGAPIYHTNVIMNIGEELAVICDEAIPDSKQRTAVLARLGQTGHTIVSLSYGQLESFAGNMLELKSVSGNRVIAMSGHARRSLADPQIDIIEKNATIVSTAIDEIEQSAGGSVRCMLAEVHLPLAGSAD